MNRARARAIARVKRPPDPMPWLVLLWLLLGLLVAGTAMGQTAPGAGTPLAPPGGPLPGQAVTPGPAVPDTPGGNTRNGVATPVPNPDPGIARPVPVPSTTMPVIRPPGTPGGNPNVVPK